MPDKFGGVSMAEVTANWEALMGPLPPPSDVMRAWDEACVIAYRLGRKPVINFPEGLVSRRITALIDSMTGEEVPVNWLPPELFPSRLPAQYFNPDLILRAADRA